MVAGGFSELPITAAHAERAASLPSHHGDPFDRMLRDGGLFESGEPLWLVGHSLGGYLVGRYAMRIHDRGESMTTASTSTSASPTTAPNVTKLVLASPVGFRPLPPPPRREP